MSKAGRAKRGPDTPALAELELFASLRDVKALRAHLAAEVRRIELEAQSWADVGEPFSSIWLQDATELRVRGQEEPHPYIKVTFVYRPTRQKIAYAIPLVDDSGQAITDPLMDLQEVLDTQDLGAKGRLSYPDDDGYHWLHQGQSDPRSRARPTNSRPRRSPQRPHGSQ